MKGENMSPFIRENSDKPARLLARTFFKELRANGYTHEQILLFSSEMIDCLNKELSQT
jgi:dsDNA-specific endonuclease/ATPase MutS2